MKHYKKEHALIALSCVIALATAFLFQFALPLNTRSFYTLSPFPWVLALGLFVWFKKDFPSLRLLFDTDKRCFFVLGVSSFILASFIVQGAQLVEVEYYDPLSFHLILGTLSLSVVIVLGLRRAWRWLPPIKEIKREPFRLKWYLGIFLIILICWIPYFLSTYPGLFCYDMGGATGELESYRSGSLTTHFPLFHVLFVGGVVEWGTSVFGAGTDLNAGIAVLTCSQLVLLDLVFTCCLGWMAKRGAHRGAIIAALIYFALDPVIALFAMCTVRDTLFSAAVVMASIFAYAVLTPSKRRRDSIGALMGLGVSCIMLCLLRNNGFYVVILLGIVLVVLAKHGKLVIAGVAAVVVLFAVIWTGPISNELGVTEEIDQKKEVLGLPIQHLAYISTSGKLSESEMWLLQDAQYIFPNESSYHAKISDPSKYTIKNMTPESVLGSYFVIALNHVDDCLYAELSRTQDLWSPYSYVNCYNGLSSYYEDKSTSFFAVITESPGVMDSKNPALLEFLEEIGGGLSLQRIPLVSALVSLPFYLMILIISLVGALAVRDRAAVGALFVFLATVITSYFGPCVLPRYYMYLFFGLPLMCFVLFKSHIHWQRKSKNASGPRRSARKLDNLAHR